MKTFSGFRLVGLGLATAGAMAATQTVSAKEFAGGELSASAAVANIYLFRGVDQSATEAGSGSGSGAISGDLTYNNSGAYLGVWATSGMSGTNETDVFLGYGIELDSGLSIDLNLTTYVYSGNVADGTDGAESVGDFSEAILSVGYATDDFSTSIQYADNIAGGSGYTYLAFAAGAGDFNATLGFNDYPEAAGQTYDNDFTHLDIVYSYNDNLSFTLSKVVDIADENNPNKSDFTGDQGVDDSTIFVVSYSLAID